MQDLAYRAMRFAMDAHSKQKRKYTSAPYFTHLCEVAGIVSSVAPAISSDASMHQIMVATAYLHDYIEDQKSSNDTDGYFALHTLGVEFGDVVANGVMLLSDLETGIRADRNEASRMRLAGAPGWIQTIKCADLISNTSSIAQYDPKFSVTYMKEKRLLLEVLLRADNRLHAIASGIAESVK